MSRYVIPIGNAFCVKVTNFKDCAGAAVTDAVLRFTLYDRTGTVVPGVDGVLMPYDAGTETYSGMATPTTDLDEDYYKLVIEAANYAFRREQFMRAVIPTFAR